MIKCHLIVAAFFLILNNLVAQDTIVKRNGDIIYARVLEIGPAEVKYKRSDFSDGPLYVETKEAIKSIRYSNGLKEEYVLVEVKTPVYVGAREPDYIKDRNKEQLAYGKIQQTGTRFYYKNSSLGENELHSILLKTKDKEIVGLVGKSKDSRALQYIGFGAIPLGIGAVYLLQRSGFPPFYYQYGPSNTNNGDLALSAVCFVAAIACPIGSGIFKQKRKASNRAAIELYNSKY
jgi:hypothetical protein